MTTQTKHTYHAELKHAIEKDGPIDGNVLSGCLAEWEVIRNTHYQLVEALRGLLYANTVEGGPKQALSNADAALAIAEKGME